MLRSLLQYLVIKFHIIEGKPPKDAVVTIMELLPMVMGCAIIIGAIKYLGIEGRPMPWYKRLWYRIRRKHYLRRLRIAVIGW